LCAYLFELRRISNNVDPSDAVGVAKIFTEDFVPASGATEMRVAYPR
jgi:hypothetical protein